MWEKHLKKKARKGPASLLKISLWESSVSVCANQPPGFSLSRTSIPKWVIPKNQWIKKISELLRTTPLTILNFLVTIKVGYFLFFTYVKSLRSTITWKENLPHINKFLCSLFSSACAAIRILKWVQVWQQLDNEVTTWFP